MARRLCIVAIIAICLGVPMAETFDSWDQTAQDGNDTEANVVVLVLCIGVAFATGTVAVVNQIRAHSSTRPVHVAGALRVFQPLVSIVPPVPTSSPPAVLRV